MRTIFEHGHFEIMRHIAKASRRGDFKTVERLTLIADRLQRMHHRNQIFDLKQKNVRLKNAARASKS